MLVSLEINDNKALAFLEFLKGLDFVAIQNSELDQQEYTNLLNERITEYNSNTTGSIEFKKALNDLKFKYDI